MPRPKFFVGSAGVAPWMADAVASAGGQVVEEPSQAGSDHPARSLPGVRITSSVGAWHTVSSPPARHDSCTTCPARPTTERSSPAHVFVPGRPPAEAALE